MRAKAGRLGVLLVLLVLPRIAPGASRRAKAIPGHEALLAMGGQLVDSFLRLQGDGNLGPTVETQDGGDLSEAQGGVAAIAFHDSVYGGIKARDIQSYRIAFRKLRLQPGGRTFGNPMRHIHYFEVA